MSAGKGSKPRPYSPAKYDSGYSTIKWGGRVIRPAEKSRPFAPPKRAKPETGLGPQ